MTPSHFQRCFRYDAWANANLLAHLAAVLNLDPRSRQIMAHLLISQKIWMYRMTGRDASVLPLWPDISLDECRRLLDEDVRVYGDFLDDLSPAALLERARYTNTKGVEFRTARVDILTHILMHGGYHRGQIATALKRQGVNPIETDYISFARAFPDQGNDYR